MLKALEILEVRIERRLVALRQDNKKVGKFLGKWNEETDTRKLNKAEQFEQFIASW